jgi:hypothetical protein
MFINDYFVDSNAIPSFQDATISKDESIIRPHVSNAETITSPRFSITGIILI